MTIRVKICGLADGGDARLADRLGAAFLGVVVTPGFGRSVDPEEAGALLEGTTAQRVAVLVDETPAEAMRKAALVGASVLQLHGDESVRSVAELRDRGAPTLWKAVRARALQDVVDAVERYGPHVDGLLFEGWKDGVIGGGGASLELDPRSVRDAIPTTLTFLLAGGLAPENVSEAVALYRPDVVDVSSGVAAGPRRKDPDRMRAFFDRVAAIAAAEGRHTV